jgi:hypothetical protein
MSTAAPTPAPTPHYFTRALNVTQAEIDRANTTAVVSIVLALITYFFILSFLCWRRCCNARLGFGKFWYDCLGCGERWFACWLCDFRGVRPGGKRFRGLFSGRCFSRSPTWVFMMLGLAVSLAGVVSLIVFYAQHPWTAQFQHAENPCGAPGDAEGAFGPCRMSWVVFRTGLVAYVLLPAALVLGWCSWPLWCWCLVCAPSLWAYEIDDRYDRGEVCCLGGNMDAEKGPEYRVLEEDAPPGVLRKGTTPRGGQPRQVSWSEMVEEVAIPAESKAR